MSARRGLGPLALALLLTTLLPRCAPAAAPATLRVFAAASLTGAFGDLARAFERAHPGVRVVTSFAGSQQLAMQLEQGAAADVFASADERWMAEAASHQLLAGPAQVFARNHLVAIVPAVNPARIARLQDLARDGVKLVLCADAVPVGRYARTVLANLSQDPAYGRDFAARALRNVVSEEENVKSVVGKVQLGEADAGICYRSDVTPAVARFVHVLELPPGANVTATYPLAVLGAAARPADAQAFVELVLSPTGQRTLARWGLEPAAGDGH